MSESSFGLFGGIESAVRKFAKSRYRIGLFLLIFMLGTVVGTPGPGYAKEEVGPGVGQPASTNGVSIYVGKLSKTLTLSQNGKEIGTYPVSIGSKSLEGDKEIEGDLRTPSGEFYVCTRNDKSICYLALGLSYPSISDAERGYEQGLITETERDEIIRANNAGEQPPWNTALGGAIEIHGERNPNGSTQGCVAVDNDVMDILWQYCNLGVPVTIGP